MMFVINKIYTYYFLINKPFLFIDLECGSPAKINNGSYRLLNGTRHYLSTVQYTCNEGHVLVGRGSLVCDVDEKWNGPPPRCDRKYYFI